MQLYFSKIHGAGNDFIVIDDLSNELELSVEQVTRLCDRHYGIGADGIILVRPSLNAGCVAYMHYVNGDGSLAEMCGNGVRCFAKFLVDKGFVSAAEGHFVADTLAGQRLVRFQTDEDGLLTLATVDMGEPAFAPEAIPTTLAANAKLTLTTATGEKTELAVLDGPLATALGELSLTCVNMGNPHAVIFLDQSFAADPVSLDIQAIGSQLETDAVFPQKANIEFAAVVREPKGDRIVMRVWERGCGETLACGTGACATAVAAAVTERAGRKSTLQLPGGDLGIEWLENNHVLMTGPAVTVFEGTIEI
jgi:diaminopimelate epimerase